MANAASNLRFELGARRLTATLSIEPHTDPDELSESLVEAFLIERGLPPDPDRTPRIRALLAAQAGSPELRHACVVAEGVPPREGVDGKFELAPELASDSPAPTLVDPPADPAAPESSAYADHYASRIRRTVCQGSLLGRFLPPVDGVDGFDVLGDCVAARPARPSPTKFDETATLDAEGRLTAAVGGIVQLTPGSIRVNPTLEIRGNVDFSTGSVDFPGDVVVFGDVRDCFTVKSGRDLTVHHLVDGATLHAARDCTLRHGMASKDRHKVVVGRNLDARYLSGVDCHVGGIARIESDITHCLLEVRGDVLGPECCVVHGELRVDRSCDVAELGSQAGIETVVRIASEDRSAAYVERAQQLLSTLQSRIVKAEERVRDLRSVHGRMTSSQADALTELSFEVERLGSMKGRLQAGLGRLKALSIGAAAGVTVRRVIHPGVTIALGRWTITFTELARGPIRLRISPHGEPEFAHPDTGDLQPTPSGARITAPAPVALAQAA